MVARGISDSRMFNDMEGIMGDDKFTWDDGDVVFEHTPDPGAKPIIAPEHMEAARKLLDEIRARRERESQGKA